MLALIVSSLVAIGETPIRVDPSPDQPFSIGYLDEPVVVELSSREDVKATLEVEAVCPGQQPVQVDMGALRLVRNEPLWLALPELPSWRGPNELTFVFHQGGETTTRTAALTRLSRPLGGDSIFAVRGDRLEHPALQYLRYLPVSILRFDLGSVEETDRLRAARAMGLKVHVAITPGGLTGTSFSAAVSELKEYVDVWEVAFDSVPRFSRTVEALRNSFPDAVWAATIQTVDDATHLVNLGYVPELGGLVLPRESANADHLRRLRALLDGEGVEAMPLHVIGEGDGLAARAKPSAADVWEQLRTGIDTIELDHLDVLTDGRISPEFCALNAIAAMKEGLFVGTADLDPGVAAAVFRVHAAGSRWRLVYWSTDAEPDEVVFSVGQARNVQNFDSLHNPAAAPDVISDMVLIEAQPEPQYLEGEDGDLLAQTAAASVRQLSKVLLEDAEKFAELPPQVVQVLRSLSALEPYDSARFEFFTVLRTLPQLEQGWYSGRFDGRLVAAIVAKLVRLAESLAVYEHETGRTFIEPLPTTLRTSQEFLDLYEDHSEAFDDDHPRVAVLKDAVSRLVDRARDLDSVGRNIEADALASIAEWRARSLAALVEAGPPDNVSSARTQDMRQDAGVSAAGENAQE